MNIAMIGDSTFDNRAYVTRGQKSVAKHLAAAWPGGVTLLARDGAVIGDVAGQLAALPDDTTHLVVSVGGNDLLRAASVLRTPVRSVAGGLLKLHRIQRHFENAYELMLEGVVERCLPTLVCTVYNTCEPPGREQFQRAEDVAVSIFDDVIYRTANLYGLDVLDLRDVLTEPADYANPIEPSHRGGLELARAIADHFQVGMRRVS